METNYEFDGQEIFITKNEKMVHVYRAPMPGVYWFDQDRGRGRNNIETGVLVQDDFGNLIDGFDGAHQRAHFRKSVH